jgi:hypothetical protein
MNEHRVQESAYTRCGGVREIFRARVIERWAGRAGRPTPSSRSAPTAPFASRAHIVVILVAVAGFAVVILAAGSITLLTALLLTAWLPAGALPAALATLLAAALTALMLAALVLAAMWVALRLVAVFRITLRSVAIRHVHASCIQLLGKDSPGPDTRYDPAAQGLIGYREFPR